MIYTYIVYYYIMFILFSARNTISYVSPRRRLIINKGMFYKYSGFRLTFRGLSHWSTMGGTNGTCHFEILHLSSTLININRNVRYDESSAIFLLRDPSLWFFVSSNFVANQWRVRSTPSDRPLEISKREIPSIITRALSPTGFLSFPTDFDLFGAIKSNKESCYALSLCMTQKRCTDTHAYSRIHTPIRTYVHTHTHTQRLFLLYFHDIEKYVNLKKIYIYIICICIYLYVYMYIPCLCALYIT